MKLKVDSNFYGERQEIFTGEMIARIADHLEESGVEGEKLKDLTGKIAFEIAKMIDDVSGIEFDGVEANPLLTFVSGKDYDELIYNGGSSTCHEMVHGILDAMFNKNT